MEFNYENLADFVAMDHSADKRLFVEFNEQAVLNIEKSNAAKRPIYDTVDYIRIAVPGDKDNIVHRPYRTDAMHPNSDVHRFGELYAKWKAGHGNGVSGTPLSVLTQLIPPILTMGQVKEFEGFNVKTAEQLAAMPDGVAQRFMGIQALKQKVQAFLDSRAEAAGEEHLQAELKRRDAEIAELRAQMAQLAGGAVPAAPKRRGRPPREKVEETQAA